MIGWMGVGRQQQQAGFILVGLCMSLYILNHTRILIKFSE